MAERLTFPQSGDADDAEHFASMIGQDNLAGFVEEGLDFTVNYTVPEVQVTTGKGYIQTASSTASSSGDTVLKTNHVIQVPAQTVSLAANATNYVYLQPDLSTDDNGTVAAFTSTQPGDALLIGVIDTSANTSELRNREPSGSFRELRLGDDQSFIFGSDDDYFVEYDSVNDKLSIDDAAGNDLVDFNDNLTRFFNDLDLEDNALTDVGAINGGGDKVNIDDDIDVTGVSIVYGNNAGVQKLVDMPVDSASAAGTEHSYDLRIDDNQIFQVYAESDGVGGLQNVEVNIFDALDVNGNQIRNIQSLTASGSRIGLSDPLNLNANNLEDGIDVIWNATAGYIEQTALENDSVTVVAGDGLKDGGVVALGGSTTVNIEPADFAGDGVKDDGADNIAVEPADFAGLFLSDDGTDNLQVNIGTGIENDGTGNIRVDEDFDFTFTSAIDFSAGLDTQGNITDGTQVIWDVTAQEIPDSAMGSIDNTTLTNDSVTVTPGDGLKGGGTVALGGSITHNIEPADFAGAFLSDDGLDNLEVDISRGLEDDGAGNIQVDEDTDFTFTQQVDFNAGWSATANVDMNSNQVTNLPDPVETHHAARKAYVDAQVQGLALKDSVDVATNGSNIDLASATDPNPIDGYTLADGEFILIKDQTNAAENGIYVANTAADPTTWTRRMDMDEDTDAISGAFTFIEKGTNNANSSWIVTTDDPITLGTTDINWAQFANAGEITAGDGLTKTGQTLDIFTPDFAGLFLSDDGTNNLAVDIGRGLENDGAGNIRVDEDTDFTFTSAIDFSAGLDTQGNITDGAQTIWDATGQEIPDSALGAINNATLVNDSVTVTAGTSLTGGGAVALGGTTTINHGDTSTQGNVATNGATVIDDLDLDGHGHLTNINTENRAVDNWTKATGGNLGYFRVDRTSALDGNNSIEAAGTQWLGLDSGSGGSGVLLGYYNAPEVRIGNNVGTIDLRSSGIIDASTSDRFRLPSRTTDPAAGAGDMWYRTDLD